MDLREFLRDESLSVRKFCKKIDISVGTVYNIFRGKKVRQEVADKIYRVSSGKIILPVETTRLNKKCAAKYNNILDYRR